jgi:DNA invertase Pin-like site-specific DNA recombinase
LLTDAQPGDILLVEQVDRLSRLTSADWEKLKAELTTRHVRVVALDLPTSWMMATNNADEFTGRMFEAINGGAGRHKVKRRPRQRAATRAVQRTPSAMPALPACSPRVAPGASSRT